MIILNKHFPCSFVTFFACMKSFFTHFVFYYIYFYICAFLSFVKGHRLVAESLVVFFFFFKFLNQGTLFKILICLILVTHRFLLFNICWTNVDEMLKLEKNVVYVEPFQMASTSIQNCKEIHCKTTVTNS